MRMARAFPLPPGGAAGLARGFEPFDWEPSRSNALLLHALRG